MREKIISLILLMEFLVFTLIFGAVKTYIVDTVVGDVVFSKDGGNKWEKVYPEQEILENYIIKTGAKSLCEISIPNRGTLKIIENSIIEIKLINQKSDEIKVKNGSTLVNVNKKLKGDESFKINTDVAVAAVRGTEFIINADQEKIKCQVADGKVALTRNINPEVVKALKEQGENVDKLLTVEASANQEVELTMSENKALEAMLDRVKNNARELKKILSENQKADMRKVIMIKNVKRVIKELYDIEDKGEEIEEDSGDNE